MPGSIKFKLSPAVLQWARTSLGYTVEQAAKKVALYNHPAGDTGIPNDQNEIRYCLPGINRFYQVHLLPKF